MKTRMSGQCAGLAAPEPGSSADYRANARLPLAGDLPVAGERGRWRIARLRAATGAVLSARRQLGRQGSARCQAGRSADRATKQVRASGESQDCKRTRYDDLACAAIACRRGDRVKRGAFITLLGA